MGEVLSRNRRRRFFTKSGWSRVDSPEGDKITVKCQQGKLIITKDGTRADSVG
ncbi:hypothetical protein [Sporofaciens musculi]|uniref:hypothetical protein n=1 Tax=Sporofaciens musculi TaxID=2681861 RepID=UPI001FCC367C|nr:hypothetical protein [Sporofaciens musculi]